MGGGASLVKKDATDIEKIQAALKDVPAETRTAITSALESLIGMGIKKIDDIEAVLVAVKEAGTDEQAQVAPANAAAEVAQQEKAAQKKGESASDPYSAVFVEMGGDDAVNDCAVSVEVQDQFEDPRLAGKQDKIFQSMGFDNMSKCADHVMKVFEQFLAELTEKVKAHGISISTLHGKKGSKRGNAKARVTYGGDCALVSDVVRGTIIVDGDIGQLYKTLEFMMGLDLFQSTVVKVIGFEDRFKDPMPGNYRDLQLILRVCNMATELQMNIKKMVDIKESAAGHGNYEEVRLSNDKALLACMEDNVEDLRDNLQHGAKANCCERKFGITNLHFAACYGNLEAVELLLQVKADPLRLDKFDYLPLQRAVHLGHFQVAGRLLQSMENAISNGSKSDAPPAAGLRVASAVGMLLDQKQFDMAKRLDTWILTHWNNVSVGSLASLGRQNTLAMLWADEGLRKHFVHSADFMAYSKEHGVDWIAGLSQHQELASYIFTQLTRDGDIYVCLNVVRLLHCNVNMAIAASESLAKLLTKDSVAVRKAAFKLLRALESKGVALSDTVKQAMQECKPDPNMLVWLQAEDVDGEDTAFVKEWPDVSQFTSSDNKALTQESEILQPKIKHNQLSGRHSAVKFSGGQQLTFYDSYITAGPEKTGLTFFVVVNDVQGNNPESVLFDEGFKSEKGVGVSISENSGFFYTPKDHGGKTTNCVWSRLDPGGHVVVLSVVFGQHASLEIDNHLIEKTDITIKCLDESTIALAPEAQEDKGPFTLGGQSKSFAGKDVMGRQFNGGIVDLRAYDRTFTDEEKRAVVEELAVTYDMELKPPLNDEQRM